MAKTEPKKSCKKKVSRWATTAKTVPLAAAILAPILTLLDIPALTQAWYSRDGIPLLHNAPSTAMSSVSLAFSVIGNALLIVRFSSNSPSIRALAVEAPLVAFWIKTIVEIVNLSLYGRHELPADYVYGEGFWCAVFSCGMSGIVALLLLWHFAVQHAKDWEDSIKIRVEGRHFILSVSSFVAVIALQALVFSRIEGWSFFDGVFFSIVTCLTVGSGHLSPSKTSTRIILFPFALVAIALLASQVSMIIGFFDGHDELRRNKYRAQRMMLANEGRSVDDAKQWGLTEEMDYLDRMQRKERQASQMVKLIISLSTFLLFWVLGAVVFKYAEGWTMGSTLYFTYVSFLTIGYGDYSPVSNLGRVWFVLWSLVAVPVVASFAVQTITTIIETVSDSRLAANKISRTKHMLRSKGDDPEDVQKEDHEGFPTHAKFVSEKWRKIQQGESKETDDDEDDPLGNVEKKSVQQGDLTERALDLTCRLEALSRSLLIGTLDAGSKAQNLLRADRNVQRRDMKEIGSGKDLDAIWEEEDKLVGASEDNLLRTIGLYRKTFAEFLVVGSLLRQLEGTGRQAFLRMREYEDDASETGTRAEREKEQMNEMDGPTEVQDEDGEQFHVDTEDPENNVDESDASESDDLTD